MNRKNVLRVAVDGNDRTELAANLHRLACIIHDGVDDNESGDCYVDGRCDPFSYDYQIDITSEDSVSILFPESSEKVLTK